MPNIRLRLNTRLVPALVGVLLLVEVLGLYRGWRVLLVGLGLAWLIAYLWSRSLARGLKLQRELRFGWLQVGDRLLERLTIKNNGRFPALWVEVDDRSTLPGHRHSRSLSVGGAHSIRWFKETTCSLRGLYTLGPITMRTGDPFGFYSVVLEYPTAIPVLVLPQVVELPTIAIAPGGRAGEGKVRPKVLERTVSAASVREYLPGDHYRWIHWPTTARRDNPFVRILDSAPAGDLWIVIDTNKRVHLGRGMQSTEEHAVVLAASLADRGLQSGRAVGLAAADHELVWLPPRGGETQRWQILHSLALLSQGNHRLSDLLLRLSGVLGRDTSLVVLTPDAEPSWVEALASLMRSGISPTVMQFDRVSFGGRKGIGNVISLLTDLGAEYHIVTRDLLEVSVSEFEPRRIPRVSVAMDAESSKGWEVVL